MHKKLIESCIKFSDHFAGLTGAHAAILDLSGESAISNIDNPAPICTKCLYRRRDTLCTHFYGVNEAFRWGGRYIYYCPLGLIFIASSLSDENDGLLGGIVIGPIVMGNLQDTVQGFSCTSMYPEIEKLPLLNTAQVQHLTEILSAVTAAIAGKPHSELDDVARRQEKLLNTIYDVREKYDSMGNGYTYPIETESKLCSMIANHDKNGSQELLNELLGQLYFYTSFNLDEIKARILELIVVMSRATINAGANVSEIFRFSSSYIREIDKYENIDQVSKWLSSIMHRFISSVFDYVRIKHSDVVYKVMEYIRNNYSEKLTLDELARHVYLNKSYLSGIFKEETGISISAFTNKVRLEKSKELLSETCLSLMEISQRCGFEDQSYYAKVFKKQFGISPKKYRDSLSKTF